METRKEFECPRRDGTKAKFVFTKDEGVWFWDLPKHIREAPQGAVASLPLPDVDLDNAKNLKECLNLIGQKRGEDWVGQIVVDLLKPIRVKA